ncbi:MAG: site-specific integrase [Desulfuromonas sp.]|nr:site-specific integrase [Desulfuromonas sp.]
MTVKRMCNLLLGFNPVASVEKLEEDGERVRVLTKEEQTALFEEVRSSHLRVAIHIGLNTGLRKKNVIKLRWDDIIWDEGVIRTRLVKKKSNPLITIPMTKKLQEELSLYRNEQQAAITNAEERAEQEIGSRRTKALSVARNARSAAGSPHLFPSPRNPQQAMRADANIGFTSACKRAGIEDFRFHDLRHTFASNFAMATGDLGALRELLGHSDIKMTMRYSHFSTDHKKARMAQFESAMS